jgi:hypothetical protein
MQNNKRTLFKVGAGVVAASAIAAGVIMTQTGSNASQFSNNGQMNAQDYEYMAYVSKHGKNYST